ncbi:MAG: SIMPL domain-containing protein [bacterium]|nr:SIMPL domain-containing protein [bacterium]
MKILPGLGISLVLLASSVLADDALEGRHITVDGTGTVRGRPDLAIAELGVTSRGESATAAMAENKRMVASLLQALKDQDVAEADVLTTDFDIHRELQNRRGADDEEGQERFVVRNLVQVTVRDIERAGYLLDKVVEAGANEVRGIRFTLQDDTQMAAQARELAAADAHAKAIHLAQLHDARLGKVLRISESGFHAARPEAMMMRAMDSSSSTVSAGELTFTTQLQIIYQLKD